MSMSFPSPRIPDSPGQITAAGAPQPARPEPAAVYRPDMRRTERADCCPARPAVIAVLPAAGRRPADLLFCGHHYRKSRQALAACGAVFLDIAGYPLAAHTWL